MISKNDIVEIAITGITAEGSGVGRVDGMAVFVPAAAEGDILQVKILKTAKSYAFGKIEKIEKASPHRIQPDCPQFLQCGGCVFRHMTYESELRAKEQRVRDAMQRIGGFDNIKILPIVGAQNPDHYRNKAQLPIGRGGNGQLQMGFFASHSHRIIHSNTCMLQPEIFNSAIEAVQEWASIYKPEPYDEASHKGRLRHLYLRIAEATGEVMVCMVVNANGVPGEEELSQLLQTRVPGLKSFVINSNREKTNVIMGKKCRTVWGQDYITDELCGLKFNISPLSFYQINRSQAQRLYTIAGEYANLQANEVVLDLYCGTGTIGLTMASKAKKVIGIEIVEQAIKDAKTNAALNNIENAEFICADALQAGQILEDRNCTPDVVILDPPRKGCDADLIAAIVKINPARIVYVSCDPATLARDLKIFSKNHYQSVQLTPVDMFPRTAHVEMVVLMSRVEK